MAKRVLAVVGAIALVLVAVVARNLIDGDDGPSASGGGGGTDRVVVCDTDIAAACESLSGVEVRVEDSAATSAAIVAGELDDVTAWVTSSAWTEITEARATRSDIELGEPVPIAASPVQLVVLDDRADVLESHCGSDAVWRCVGDVAGRPWADIGGPSSWGPVRIGLPDPDTALGLPVLSSVAVGHFESTAFAANDFTGFRDWLARVAAPSNGGDRNLLRTLLRVRGTYDGAGLLAAGSSGQDQLAPLATEPTVSAVVVASPLDGDLPGAMVEELRTALGDAGWSTDAQDLPPLPQLGPGVMGALHALWKDVAR